MSLEDHPLRNVFHYLASASAIRAAAATAAAVQVEHYNQLRAEGLSDEVAINLTARTTAVLFNSVSSMIVGISENAPAIAEGFERLYKLREDD